MKCETAVNDASRGAAARSFTLGERSRRLSSPMLRVIDAHGAVTSKSLHIVYLRSFS